MRPTRTEPLKLSCDRLRSSASGDIVAVGFGQAWVVPRDAVNRHHIAALGPMPATVVAAAATVQIT